MIVFPVKETLLESKDTDEMANHPRPGDIIQNHWTNLMSGCASLLEQWKLPLNGKPIAEKQL